MKARSTYSDGSVAVTALLVVLLVAALAFGGWAFVGKRDFQNNTNQKIDAAVEAAKTAQAAKLQVQFDEAAKSPVKTYQGSATYGTISFSYPRTWSGLVDTSNAAEPINGYFYPDIVPGLQSQSTAFALRVELVSDASYSQAVQQYTQQAKLGKVTSSAFVPPKMNGVANLQPGVRFDGAVSATQQGSIVIIKVRDKTLKISTQSVVFEQDFNNILSSLTFVP